LSHTVAIKTAKLRSTTLTYGDMLLNISFYHDIFCFIEVA